MFSRKTLTILFALTMLTGCLAVRSEITSFSTLSEISQGDTFVVLPNDEQKTSAEFESYASSIAQRLQTKGWYRVDSFEEAKYIVLVNYGISGSVNKTSSSPIYGQTGGGTTSHFGTLSNPGTFGTTYSGTSYTAPTYGVVGTKLSSRTEHQRYFVMKVIEKSTEKAVYETKATSGGSSGQFGIVAECIFDMALENFPHQQSGRSIAMTSNCGTQK